MIWEYASISPGDIGGKCSWSGPDGNKTLPSNNLLEELNHAGRDGWELVVCQKFTYWLKRAR